MCLAYWQTSCSFAPHILLSVEDPSSVREKQHPLNTLTGNNNDVGTVNTFVPWPKLHSFNMQNAVIYVLLTCLYVCGEGRGLLRRTFGGWFPPSTSWAPEIKLRSSGMAAGALTLWTNFPAPGTCFISNLKQLVWDVNGHSPMHASTTNLWGLVLGRARGESSKDTALNTEEEGRRSSVGLMLLEPWWT